MQPTHFLRACICWCAWDLIISISLSPNSLSVCILCMTSTMLRPLASYTHTPILPSVCTYVHPCLGQYYTVLPRSLLLHVCVPHIPIHILCMCTCVLYSTRSVPLCSTLPHLTRHHVRSQVYIYYTYQYKHNIPSGMSSSHLHSYDTCVSSPTVPVTWHMPFHALQHICYSATYLALLDTMLWHVHMDIHTTTGYLHILRSIESMESMESMIWTILAYQNTTREQLLTTAYQHVDPIQTPSESVCGHLWIA